ncbi:MAG: hypothetical protein KJ630_18470 [Proteobacteria bacterium]|nr:hypothetical protein [Pseudomonadota bacterium]
MKTSNPFRFVLSSFSLSLLFCLTLAVVANGEEYRYQEQQGKEISSFTWKIESIGDKVRITVLKNGNSYISTCSSDGSTRQWQLIDIQKGTVEAARVENLINFNGKVDGEPYENTAGLGSLPWFQSPFYALGKFVNAPYRDVSFWYIREGEIVPVLLKARKRGAESVLINGEMVQAKKVEVFSDDFFSQLWRGFYWFREGDNRLVMYRSEPGIPGAKETVVTMVSSP